jgi:transposase InsO family protein
LNPISTLIVVLEKLVRRLLRPARSMSRLAIGAARDLSRSRSELLAENALLRQQVVVLRRQIDRPRLHDDDRLLLLVLARLTERWRDALHLVCPETLLRWHRDLFKIVWRRKSRPKRPPNRLSLEIIKLIQAMATDNVLWGAERIRGELLKLGIRVSKRTIQKYMREVRPPGKRGQTWSTFIRNHSLDVWACDFLQHYDVLFRPIFAFFVVVHGTREIVHLNVTRHPTDAWVAQQLREATPFGDGPRYLFRDNDDKFGRRFEAVAEGTSIEVVKIPPRSPNLNAICERFLGSVRRECLDYVVILGERHLRRILEEYVATYFNPARPHQGLSQRIPAPAAPRTGPRDDAKVVALPILGGLHHDYRLAA